ncbi:MAG TPA: DUF3048 domain-containing protein [Actinomycetota bacterium]|nr:DUF3048 domain-containing protein [Actinomycetota bacterium]
MKRALTTILAVLLIATACSAHKSPAASKSSAPAPPAIAPLTGLVVPHGSAFLTRAALAVKIENTPDARPQSGLDNADIVVEEQVEGGITRFIAIFQSRDARVVGPVRSARPEDPDLLRQYGAILAFSGGAQYVIDHIRHTPNIVMLGPDQAGSAFYRVAYRAAPHNLYSSTQALYRAVRNKETKPPTPPFKFSSVVPTPMPSPVPTASPTATPNPAPVVKSGRTLSVDFSTATYRATWRWSRLAHAYMRFEGSVPHRVASGKQLSAQNVLVVYVTTYQSTHVDAAGHTTPIARVYGSGKVILFRNGVQILGTWTRRTLNDPMTFSTTTGTPLLFAPGVTWVELTPIGVKVSSS